jgi:hypothetical protein
MGQILTSEPGSTETANPTARVCLPASACLCQARLASGHEKISRWPLTRLK